MSLGLHLQPLLPWTLLAALAVLAGGAVAWTLWRGTRGAWARAAAAMVLLGVLSGPRVVDEDRRPETDIALLLIDRSASQSVGDRAARTDRAAAALTETLAAQPDLEVRGLDVDSADGATRLAGALRDALTDVPDGRFAGAFLITDGQAHDTGDAGPPPGAPLHLLLTDHPGRRDRRVTLLDAPAFGLVGQRVPLRFRIDDPGLAPGGTLPVEVQVDGAIWRRPSVAVGVPHTLRVPVNHPGRVVIGLAVGDAADEVSTLNNRTATALTGIRDRVRVMLVSGRPHPGQRAWRNLLKSDPAVDLVHFTILRPASRVDATPLEELALISFPTRELFEERLHDFDLVIFDRYVVRNMLAPSYYANLAEFVTGGGAFLLAAGPEFAGPATPARTHIATILPLRPDGGRVVETPFRPTVTELGNRHPVTAGLPDAKTWGRWYRIVAATASRGDVLMDGPGGLPLLVLDRIGKGRVAALTGDQIWLWGRGHDGGGPQGELLRRMLHWLMKEPDLEENRLAARIDGGRLEVGRRSLDAPESIPVRIDGPDGAIRDLILEPASPGLYTGRIAAPLPGVYQVRDEDRAALAVGPSGAEFEDLRAATAPLKPLVEASGGGVFVLPRDGVPSLRRVRPGRPAAGDGWAALYRNRASVRVGLRDRPLLTGWAVAGLVLGLALAGWWREGR